MIHRVVFLAVTLCLAGTAHAQQPSSAPRRSVRAVRTTEPPVIDGRLSEEAWARAAAADAFTQRDPHEGQPASERTEIRFLYDEDALYIGATLYDSEPAKIARRLASRDDWDSDADRLMIYLDPRHDRRTGVNFFLSAAGVQRDAVISNDTNEDGSWDAVWTSAVAIDAQGWTAELRIPFSQLRFNAADVQIWGMNIARFIQRKNETAWLELVPKNENGLASRMIDLVGLDGIRPRRNLEVAPYTAVRQEFVEPGDAGDPFNDGSRMFGAIGVDLKARVVGGLTLDATINPDFGQAEVDPAVVNLSAFETYFPEKRRFFIEGADIFNNFGNGGANNFFGFNNSDPTIFYSRRIGRSPQGSADGDFVDEPRATTILGAAKLTGKTANGWTIGILDALTGRESARVVTESLRSRTPVEPMTNYFVGRMHRDFSRAGVGFLATSVLRTLGTQLLKDQLTSRATVFGGDAFYFFDKKKDWVVTGRLSGSRVSGTETAITELQRGSQRYYQRPDAPQVSFDPHRTSLSGYAGRVNLNRNSGVWQVNAALWGVSPGFESNDLGFHSSGDRAGAHGVLLWRKQSPDRWTRSRSAWLARAWTWNFNREIVSSLWFSCANVTFLNYWYANTCARHSYRTLDDQLTRGGPLAISPRSNSFNGFISTDSRKWISLQLSGGPSWDASGGWGNSGSLTVSVKPLPSLSLSTGPSVDRSLGTAQYIQAETDPGAAATFGTRYVFASIDQTQVSLTTRVNYIVSPRASLQVFMQPLLASGRYDHFKELTAPRTYDFREYASSASFRFSQDPIARVYSIETDPTGALSPFSFDNPDFNFKSLRINAVFRWEFRPGSTLYAVWTQQREDLGHPSDFRFGRDAGTLFTTPSNDVFLVKMTYWLGH